MVPEKESTIHKKDRERAKLDNPFNAGKLKVLEPKRTRKKEDVWAPTYEVCDCMEEGVLQPWCSRLSAVSR
jgi:hypothetical protein